VSFLRRLFGGAEEPVAAADADAAQDAPPGDDGLDADAAEREHERAVLRAEAERLDDLRQRQLRYAAHAWTPPSEGGDRRADDEDSGAAS
jgi:hypothetical protein